MDDNKQAEQNQPEQAAQANSDSPDPTKLSADQAASDATSADSPQSPSPETSDGGVISPVSAAEDKKSDTDVNESDQTGSPQPMPQIVSSGGGNKRWLKWGVPAAVVVILAAVAIYIFLFYLPNRPSAVYSAGLTNTGKALDNLIDYSKTQQVKTYKSTKLSGTLDYSSSSVSGNASLSGVIGQHGNSKLTGNMDIMGKKITLDMLTSKAAHNDSPDLYIKVGGVKNILGAMSPQLATYSDKWLLVDHTLVDTYKKDLAQLEGGQNKASAPTYAQVNDAAVKVETVNKQYLFTTDPNKAVLKNEKFVGKETKNGRTVYHYKMSYNKAHLKAYVKALSDALNSSQLNDWYKAQDPSHKNISQLDETQINKQIDKADPNYKFDMWVDQKTKLIESLKFNSSDGSSVVISQDYTGGNVYPFTVEVDGKDNGKPATATIGFTINTDTNQYDFTANIKDASSNMKLTADLKLTPSNETVKVSVPKHAKSITDLLIDLFGGSQSTKTKH